MDYKFTFQDGTEALAHYGVKGMKWGVWNAETAARYGKTTKGLTFKTDETHPLRDVYVYSKPLGEDANSTLDSRVRKGTLDRYLETHEDYGRAMESELQQYRMKPEDLDSAFTKVNNLYGAPGYDDNCMGCSISTILRTKGFDVEADSSLADYTDEQGGAIKSLNMSTTAFVSSIFGRDLHHLDGVDEAGNSIYDSLGNITVAGRELRRKAWKDEPKDPVTGEFLDHNHADRSFYASAMGAIEPEGSYGVVRGGYNGGSGHILTYRIEDGRPVCYDGQTSQKKSFEDATREFNWSSIKYTRLDDVDPSDINYEELGKWGGVRPHESHWDD